MARQSTILITGGAGFIGASLGRALLARGHTVIGYDLVSPENAAFPIIAGDIRDAGALTALCKTYNIERIVHGGGVSGRSVSRSDPSGTIDINVMGTVAVLEAATKQKVCKVVLCSSGSVYGRSKDALVTEHTSVEPVNAYGASKVAAEAVLNAYRAEHGLDGIALRIFQAYGPHRQTRCTIRTMVLAAAQGKVADLPFGAEARLQYVYIDDVVAALASAILSDPLPEIAYNIPGACTLTLGEAADIAARVLPGLKVHFGDSSLTREYSLTDVDYSPAARDLGYKPQFDLARGIRAYVNELGSSSGE